VRRPDGARDAQAIAAAAAPRSGNVINGVRAVSPGAASPGAQGPLHRGESDAENPDTVAGKGTHLPG